MKTPRWFLTLALLALLAPTAGAGTTEQLFVDFDVDSGTFTYPSLRGADGENGSAPRQVPIKIKTSGSSTSVTAYTAGTQPFVGVAVGDQIILPRRESNITAVVPVKVVVLTRADADNITVSAAVDLTSGYTFGVYKAASGTAATDGWFAIEPSTAVVFQVAIDQIVTTTGIDYQIECKVDGATSGVIVTGPTTKTTTAQVSYSTTDPWAWCRVGLRLTSTDDGDDLTTNKEKVSGFLAIRHTSDTR